jgi:hypothetical protein
MRNCVRNEERKNNPNINGGTVGEGSMGTRHE